MANQQAASWPRLFPASAVAITLLVVPWLWPFASGPTPSVIPRMVSLACGLLWLLVFLFPKPGHGVAGLLTRALLLAALLSSVIGLLQYFGASSALAPWVNVTGPGYAFGNLRQKNQLASLLNIGLAVLIWTTWTRPWRATADDGCRVSPRRSRIRDDGLLVLAVLLLASASAATVSRTGFVQMLTLLALAWLWRRHLIPGAWVILGGAALAYAVASVVLPHLAGLDPFDSGITARFSDGAQNCESRIILWRNVLHLIAQKPWLGWGWGELDYAHFVTVYPGARFCDILDNAHNLPLHLAVELGLPVAMALCGLAAWLVLRAKPWRETRTDRHMAWSVLALIALHSLLEYPLWYGPFQITTVLAVWILWRTRPQSGAAQMKLTPAVPESGAALHPRPGPSAALACGALMLLAALAYAAWDYRRVSQVYLTPALRASAYREDTLQKAKDSWLFQNQVLFAELTLTTVTPGNAAQVYAMAGGLLHFSPETRVIEKLIDSALVLGRETEAVFYMRRFRIAFPAAYARWAQATRYGPLPTIGH